MKNYELLGNLLASILAGGAVLGAALIAQHLTSKVHREHSRRRDEIEKIAGAVRTSEAAIPPTLDGINADTRAVIVDRPSPAVIEEVEKLMTNYHEQALNQSGVQFWFSIVAATIGFIWILAAGSAVTEKLATATKLLPGSVIDAVAFLFLKQASQTRQRATELYDRLRQDKERADSVSLILSIENAEIRSVVRAQIALHKAGLDPAKIVLPGVRGRGKTADTMRASGKEPGKPTVRLANN